MSYFVHGKSLKLSQLQERLKRLTGVAHVASAVGQAAGKGRRSHRPDRSPGQGLSRYLVFLMLFRFCSL